MSNVSRCEDSIRPPNINNSEIMSSGRGRDLRAGSQRRGVGTKGAKLCGTFDDACPCCPVAQGDAHSERGDIAPGDPLDADELIAADEQEQAEMPLVLPQVYQPTRSEYLDHCVSHYPFRAWCRHCLQGRGLKDERCTPIVSFDYCFVSDIGDVTDEKGYEAAGDSAAKILVARDSKSKSVFAHVVPRKGVDGKGFAVQSLVDDVRWLGYTKVVLKSDNEPAIVKLLGENMNNCENKCVLITN